MMLVWKMFFDNQSIKKIMGGMYWRGHPTHPTTPSLEVPMGKSPCLSDPKYLLAGLLMLKP